MTVFKTFLQILKKNKAIVILYTVILLIFGNFSLQSNQASTTFEASKPSIYIVNEDKEEGITKDLIKYIKENSETPEIKGNEQSIDDALFYSDANLIVYIPENFNTDFLSGKDVEIKIKKAPDYYSAFGEMIVKRYIRVAKSYQKAISNEDELIKKINETLSKTIEPELTTRLNTTGLSRAARYYNMASYSFLACLIYVICLVLSTFNGKDVKKRTTISSFSYKKHNRILLLSNILFSLVLWAVYVALSFAIVGDVMFSARGAIMIVNSLVFVICATCISLFIGSLVTNKNAISGIVNVIAIGSSFLCGAFVPAEWLPDFVKTIAHVLPSYYYINTNDTAAILENINIDTLMPIIINTAVILGFSLVFIVLTNIVSKKRRTIG